MTTTRDAAMEALSESTYNHPMSLVMWQSWIDDLPLPDDFDEAKNALQEYLQQLAFPTALSTPPTAQGYVERLEAVLEIVADGHSKDYTDNCILARNALAARPAPQHAADTRVVVKPLVWEGHTARTPFGSYAVHDCRGYGQTYRLRLPMGAEGTSVLAHGAELMFDTQELAQAAAQADYETRIMSAIIGTATPAQSDKIADAARAAHEALWELNPDNYDHDDVLKLNDASVEAIFLLADAIGETHGKTPEWWEARRRALAGKGA